MTTDPQVLEAYLANAFSLSTRVSANLQLVIYGVVLIAAMLLWPSGIQGPVRVAHARWRRQAA